MIKNKVKGFTLIELLLVVGIVTLLSSILFYNTSEAKKKAEDSHMESESEQVELAVTLFKEDKGRYPLSSRGPNSSVPRGKMYTENNPEYTLAMKELVDGGYIPEIPRSPDNSSYAYGIGEDEKNAMFVATLKRKKTVINSGSNSCEFIYLGSVAPLPEEPISITPCYTIPGTAGGCWMTPAVIETRCEEGVGCYDVMISPETMQCNPGTPPQTICPEPTIGTPPSLPSEEKLCDGTHETDFCKCL